MGPSRIQSVSSSLRQSRHACNIVGYSYAFGSGDQDVASQCYQLNEIFVADDPSRSMHGLVWSERKLLMPPFHGARVRRYGEMMWEITDRSSGDGRCRRMTEQM